jgi:putative pyruvate formate lyase activating enzyme
MAKTAMIISKDGIFMNYVNCTLCPRQCGIDRTAGKTGFCGARNTALVAKSMLHQWEEPVLAPNGNSGAVFFGGCTLGCKYCQNAAISGKPVGKPMDSLQLRQLFEELIAQGAENIDLVTPTHYLPTILPALEPKLPVPVVYNCGGYERVETIQKLAGKVDIYLPDLKYADAALAQMLSGAKDYFAVATQAIKEMVRQVGPVQWRGEKVVRGVIIRHLILPGCVDNSLKILDWIGETFASGEVLVSLMRQYTPMGGLPAPFDRKVSDEEYDAVLSWMYLNDLEGFTQEADSATQSFIPEF